MSTQKDKQILMSRLESLGIAFEDVYGYTERILAVMTSFCRFHPPLKEKGYGELLNAVFFGKRQRTQKEWRTIIEKHIFDYCPPSVQSIDDITTTINFALIRLYLSMATIPWDSNITGKIDVLVETLGEQSATVIRKRFGLSRNQRGSVEDIAIELHCTTQKVRSIESNSLRALRCSMRRKSLEALVFTWSGAINFLEGELEKSQERIRELSQLILEDGNARMGLKMFGTPLTVYRKGKKGTL
ncbi:MAG: sigma factor-like helix-turn-helix DNA-binding protein [Candidatus Moraniibacteriota bacterium]